MNRILSLMKNFFILFVFLLCHVVYAVNVPELYSTNVPVQSSADSLRPQAFSQALKQVLVKVSGRSSVLSLKSLPSVINKAQNYVQDYAYAEEDDHSFMLHVQFSDSSINSLLQRLGQGVWGQNRPLTLIWVLVKNQQGAEVLENNPENATEQLIQKNADQRGIPIVFPIMDLADLQSMPVNNLENPVIETIIQASARYHPDSILVINIDESQPTAMIAQWSLVVKNQMVHWETPGSSEEDLMTAGMNTAADTLARQFSVALDSKTRLSVYLTIKNLNGIDDYAAVSRYLSGLSGVSNLQILSVTPLEAKFLVVLSIPLSAFQQQMSLSALIQSISQQEDGSLVYSYNGIDSP